MKLKLIATMFIVANLLLGCGGGQTKPLTTLPIDTSTAAAVELTSIPTKVPISSETPLPTPILSLRADMPLSENGPWWIFSNDEGLWAVNPNGSGLRKLLEGQYIVSDLLDGVSPTGGHLAYITGTDDFFGLTLNLLTLPDGRSRVITALTSPESEPSPEDVMFELDQVAAISFVKSIDWSPDGRKLAFMGVMEGPTSDLYVYSLDDETITRLTDGPTQAIRPLWSPLGKYILHAGVNSMGSGAGMAMVGFWAARADGSGFSSLFDPGESGDEIVIGWNSLDTFVIFSWHMTGNRNLRSVNVETGESQVFFQGCFHEEMALHESTGTVLLAVSKYGANCIPGVLQGLYLVSTVGDSVLRIVEDEAHYIRWSEELGLFLVLMENGFLAVSPSGEFIDLDVPEGSSWFPDVAPGTKQLAWTGKSGVWIGSLQSSLDQPALQVFVEPTWKAAWGPEGQYLLFWTEVGSLYVAQSPDFIPVQVAGNLTEQRVDSAWVWP